MAEMNVDTSSKREQRNFGLVMAAAVVVVNGIHWLIRGREDLLIWPFYIAGAFFVLGLVFPRALQPIFVLWMKFALMVNWVMTRVLLSLVWFGIVTPMRIGMSLMGKDPLKRKFLPEADSYWEDAEEHPDDLEAYKNQF